MLLSSCDYIVTAAYQVLNRITRGRYSLRSTNQIHHGPEYHTARGEYHRHRFPSREVAEQLHGNQGRFESIEDSASLFAELAESDYLLVNLFREI